MILFIWQRMEKVTNAYHDEAGVAVVALDQNRARAMIEKYRDDHFRKDWSDAGVSAEIKEPDATYPVVATEERIFVFPDNGCC